MQLNSLERGQDFVELVLWKYTIYISIHKFTVYFFSFKKDVIQNICKLNTRNAYFTFPHGRVT